MRRKTEEINNEGGETDFLARGHATVRELLGQVSTHKEPVALRPFFDNFVSYIHDFVDGAVDFPVVPDICAEVSPEGLSAVMLLVYVSLRTRHENLKITHNLEEEAYALYFDAYAGEEQTISLLETDDEEAEELFWAESVAGKCDFAVTLQCLERETHVCVSFPRFRVGGMMRSGEEDYSHFIDTTSSYILQLMPLFDSLNAKKKKK